MTERFPAGLMTAGLPRASSGGFRAGAVSSGAVYPSAAPPSPRTLWEILEATAEAFPRAAAIDDGKSVLDYAHLLRWVRQLGDWL